MYAHSLDHLVNAAWQSVDELKKCKRVIACAPREALLIGTSLPAMRRASMPAPIIMSCPELLLLAKPLALLALPLAFRA